MGCWVSPSKSEPSGHHTDASSVASLEKCSGVNRSSLVRAITINWISFLTCVAHPRTTICQDSDSFPERKPSSRARARVTLALASPSRFTRVCLPILPDHASDNGIDTDKVLLPSSENSCDLTGRGASMQSTHLNTHTYIPHHSRRSLVSCLSWRRATSLIEESSTIARPLYLLLQRAGLSDADRSPTMVLEIQGSTATKFMVAATA